MMGENLAKRELPGSGEAIELLTYRIQILAAAEPVQPQLTLRALFSAHRWPILLSYFLFNTENLVGLAQPLVLGWAINDLLDGSYHGLTIFFGQYVVHALVGTLRRVYDTRVFTEIYSDLATRVIMEQRSGNVEVSCIAARSALCREIVAFFERDLPFLMHLLYSVGGALVFLSLHDWTLGLLCLVGLAIGGWISRGYGRNVLRLTTGLHDELEREVTVIGRGVPAEVEGHYERVADWRIKLSDREAWNFMELKFLVFLLIAIALVRCCGIPGMDTGRIFSAFNYMLMFGIGLLNLPMLVQQFGRLKDIGHRILQPASNNGAGGPPYSIGQPLGER